MLNLGQKYEATVIEGTGRKDGIRERKGGKPHEFNFSSPFGVIIHEPSNTCYVADTGNRAIIKITFKS